MDYNKYLSYPSVVQREERLNVTGRGASLLCVWAACVKGVLYGRHLCKRLQRESCCFPNFLCIEMNCVKPHT